MQKIVCFVISRDVLPFEFLILVCHFGFLWASYYVYVGIDSWYAAFFNATVCDCHCGYPPGGGGGISNLTSG